MLLNESNVIMNVVTIFPNLASQFTALLTLRVVTLDLYSILLLIITSYIVYSKVIKIVISRR
jgi:hypothetical protein